MGKGFSFGFGLPGCRGMVGVATAAHFLVTPGQNAYRDFEFSFGRLASRDGVPMPQDEVQKRLTQMLSDNTVSLGLLFDRIDGAQFQADAVRIAKLIDATPSLHGPANQWGHKTRPRRGNASSGNPRTLLPWCNASAIRTFPRGR